MYIHVTINVLISWQLSKQCIRWPVSPDRIAGSGIEPLSSNTILKLSADKWLLFKWSQAQVHFFKNACEISYVHELHHQKFWFQADLGRKNSAGFYMQGRQLLLTFLTMVTRWSRSSSNFHALIGQNLTGEFMRKMYAASGNLFSDRSDSWGWQSFVSPTCDVFKCLFPLDVQNEYICYQDPSVIHGWFVYWIYGWEMRHLSKSSEIQFRIALFSFITLLDASEALKGSSDSGLQELHLDC